MNRLLWAGAGALVLLAAALPWVNIALGADAGHGVFGTPVGVGNCCIRDASCVVGCDNMGMTWSTYDGLTGAAIVTQAVTVYAAPGIDVKRTLGTAYAEPGIDVKRTLGLDTFTVELSRDQKLARAYALCNKEVFSGSDLLKAKLLKDAIPALFEPCLIVDFHWHHNGHDPREDQAFIEKFAKELVK